MASWGVFHFFLLFLFFHVLLDMKLSEAKKADSGVLVETVMDAKEMKKMLRTKNNVLVLFSKTTKEGSATLKLVSQVAEKMKGQATLVNIDCGGEGKKICKKLKVAPEPVILKHYKNGEFHKDYDRKITVQSMVNFLKDPSGDMPWEEDDTVKNVLHISDPESLGRLLSKEKLPVMVMFYAPWCGFCKRLKPEYDVAAGELKGHSVLAAMDVNRAENSVVRKHFNITGFPTLLYFELGNMKVKYEGDNTKDALIKFMKDPAVQVEKPKEDEWPEDIVQLTSENFDSTLKSDASALVMFYAPWCGHCKKMKPEFAIAAKNLKEQGISGTLAAIDATKQKDIGERYKVTGYPTVKYFKNGELQYDVNFRTADKIEEFMKEPQEPPPPPPPEIPWSQMPSSVVHLTEDFFKAFLKRKKHVLVMFYAPWCGHCKKAKPEFEAAASYFKDDVKVEFAALDCIAHSDICNLHNVRAYPSIKYFSYYKVEKPYDGQRQEADFVEYMQAIVDGISPPTPPPPPSAEDWWKTLPNGDSVKLLTGATFDEEISKHDSALVMFYAPWCGHCKDMKPAFATAAGKLIEAKENAILAAVDATQENSLATKYEVKGFPTIKYFRKGLFVANYDKPRTVEDMISFVTNWSEAKDEL